MNKEKITHSFEIDGGRYCQRCKFEMYEHSSDTYMCRIFDRKLEMYITGANFELLRCSECVASGVLLEGAKADE